MNFLIISRTKNIKEAIVGSFMPLGVDILYTQSYEQAERYLMEKKIGMVFVDFDVDESLENGMHFIDEVLEEQLEDPPTIVTVSSRSNRQLVADLIEKRVKAFLIKPIDEGQLIERLVDIKNQFHYVDMDKKYYRVSPPAGAPLPIYVRSARTAKLIKGQVRNLSIGGAAFTTPDKISDEDLMENDSIDKITLKFPGTEDVELGGKVIYKLNNICAVSFRQYTNQNLRILSNYIFQHIAKD